MGKQLDFQIDFQEQQQEEEGNKKPSSTIDFQLDFQPEEELKKEKKKAGISDKETYKVPFAQVGNLVDRASSALNVLKNKGIHLSPVDAITHFIVGEKDNDKIFKEMDERIKQREQWANPENKELTLPSKIAGTIATLPMQVASFPLSPFETGQVAIDKGEKLSTAQKMGAVDTVGNLVGAALPAGVGGTLAKKAITGAAANVAQDVGTRKALEVLADTQEAKEHFKPTVENAVIAGITGAGIGAASHRKTPLQKQETKADKLKLIAEEKKVGEEAKQQLELDFGEDSGRTISPYLPDPSTATFRVDDNGIPIRQDLSEETSKTSSKGSDQLDILFDEQKPSFDADPRQPQVDPAVKAQQMDEMFSQRQEELQQKQKEIEDTLARELREDELYSLQDNVIMRNQPTTPGGFRRQAGGVNIDFLYDLVQKVKSITKPKNQIDQENAINKISQQDSSSRIPSDPSYESIKEIVLQEGHQKGANRYLGAGGTIEAVKRHSALIDGVRNIVQNWNKRAELTVRKEIMPVEETLRKLKGEDFTDLLDAMKIARENRINLSLEDLANAGYSEKVLNGYKALRELQDKSLKWQNEARVLKGLKPISPEEAYISARWVGDFGVSIKNKDGRIVWKVRADSKIGVKRAAQKILDKFPDLKLGDDFDRLNARGMDRDSLQSAYSTMLDILGRDDPIVQQIKELVEKEVEEGGQTSLGQHHHAKRKAGVRGYVGDRPWVDPMKDAKEFLQQQLEYAKNAAKWSEIQKGTSNLKKIINDPEIASLQPDRVKWAKDYVANDLGYGEDKMVRAIENRIGKAVGVSPKKINKMVGDIKFFWITQKLMASLGYTASNGFQLFNTLPWHSDLSAKGFKTDPITPAISGFINGNLLAAYHYNPKVTDIKMLPDYVKAALKYAENNSVTNRSVYDETPIGSGIGPARKAIQRTVTLPETFARSYAYMSFVEHLKNSGQFKDKASWNEMFKLAEDYTYMAMSDARFSERAQIFNKAGTVGSLFNTLQTYTISWFNQWSYFSREAFKGNPAPLFTAMVTQGSLAGLLGLPLVQDLDTMWEYTKRLLPTKLWNKVKDWNLKEAVMDVFGETGAYGAVSDITGINWSSRISSPQILEAPGMPGGMLADIFEQVAAISDAAASVDDPTKWAQAALNITPPGLKEFVAQTALPEYSQVDRPWDEKVDVFKRSDLADRRSIFARTKEQQNMAKWGVKSLEEGIEGDARYNARTRLDEARKRRQEVSQKLYNQIRLGNMDKARDSLELFVELGGNPQQLKTILNNQIKEEFFTDTERMLPRKNIDAIIVYKRMKDLLKEATQND